MRGLVSAVVLALILVSGPGVSVSPAGRGAPAAAPVGVIVVYGNSQHWTVSLVNAAGKELPVPASVRESPLGLSPDGRYVARIPGWNPWVTDLGSEQVVELVPVRGGSPATVLRGIDASYAWSPDGRQLAASASGRTGPTMLRLFDHNGRLVRSVTLPHTFEQESERAYFRVLSWSPDGSHLLLEESDPYLPRAMVALDLRSGRLRTLATFGNKDEPAVVWSPDGRYVALAEGEGFSQDDYLFAVIDVATGKPLMACTVNRPCPDALSWPLAWAPDSRSLFAPSRGGIVRLDLGWHRSTAAVIPRGFVRRLYAFADRLVYEVAVERNDGSTVSDTVYLQRIGAKQGRQIFQTRSDIGAVRVVAHLP